MFFHIYVGRSCSSSNNHVSTDSSTDMPISKVRQYIPTIFKGRELQLELLSDMWYNIALRAINMFPHHHLLMRHVWSLWCFHSLCMQQCAKPSIYSACGQAGGGAGGTRLGSAGAGEDHHHVLRSRLGGLAQEQTSCRLVVHVKWFYVRGCGLV